VKVSFHLSKTWYIIDGIQAAEIMPENLLFFVDNISVNENLLSVMKNLC